jgi:TetR/AcrR family transcriptional repressor of mexJK operon
MNRSTTVRRGRPGRPTKAETVARQSELLDTALNHFLEKGFDGATIENIAASLRMTKRTIYNRYPDKESLFLAAVLRAVERVATPAESLEAAVSDNLEDTLAAVARLRVGQVLTPGGLKLQRIINTESYRFPEIFRWAYERGAMPVINFLADLLERETRAGRLTLEDPVMAANLFVTMVVSAPVRFFVAGSTLAPEEIERRIRAGVRLFLNGALPRS